MIPGPLCVLQRAELPERRVARGGPWCRRVEVLQQVLPSPRLSLTLRGSRFESSPSSAPPSTSSSSPSLSSLGGVARGGCAAQPPRTESPGGQPRAAAVAIPLRRFLVNTTASASAHAVICISLINIGVGDSIPILQSDFVSVIYVAYDMMVAAFQCADPTTLTVLHRRGLVLCRRRAARSPRRPIALCRDARAGLAG